MTNRHPMAGQKIQTPLDHWFWSVCLAEARRSPLNTLKELQETVQLGQGGRDQGR